MMRLVIPEPDPAQKAAMRRGNQRCKRARRLQYANGTEPYRERVRRYAQSDVLDLVKQLKEGKLSLWQWQAEVSEVYRRAYRSLAIEVLSLLEPNPFTDPANDVQAEIIKMEARMAEFAKERSIADLQLLAKICERLRSPAHPDWTPDSRELRAALSRLPNL